MVKVIDFLEWSGAQRETLCGKLEREKAHRPQVLKRSMGRQVRGRHRPFQKVPGLDQEISRKAFWRPYPRPRPSRHRSRPWCHPTMILRPSLSLPGSGFLWRKVHSCQIVAEFSSLHCVNIPSEDEYQVIGFCWTYRKQGVSHRFVSGTGGAVPEWGASNATTFKSGWSLRSSRKETKSPSIASLPRPSRTSFQPGS